MYPLALATLQVRFLRRSTLGYHSYPNIAGPRAISTIKPPLLRIHRRKPSLDSISPVLGPFRNEIYHHRLCRAPELYSHVAGFNANLIARWHTGPSREAIVDDVGHDAPHGLQKFEKYYTADESTGNLNLESDKSNLPVDEGVRWDTRSERVLLHRCGLRGVQVIGGLCKGERSNRMWQQQCGMRTEQETSADYGGKAAMHFAI